MAFFPVILNWYWFITAYILVYILSPYLNIFIRAMEEKVYRAFLITLLVLYCVIPTFFGFFFNTTETILYYNRLIWMLIMYFLGAYLYRNKEKKAEKTRKYAIWMTTGSIAVMLLSILGIDRFHTFFAALGTTEPAYFWPPNTIPMLCLSLGVFGLFQQVKITYHPIINTIASTTLGIYLLHDGILASWIWITVFRCAEYQNSPFLIFRILTASLIIFVVGMTIDLLRQILERCTLDRLLYSDKMDLIKKYFIRIIQYDKGEKKMIFDKKAVKYVKPISIAARILIAISFAVLAFYQLIEYKPLYIIYTVLAASIFGFLFVKQTEKEFILYARTHVLSLGVQLLAALFIIRAIHLEKNYANTDMVFHLLPSLSVRFFRFRWLILALPALFYLLSWVWRKAFGFISDFWRELEESERKLYFRLTVISALVVFIGYMVNSWWFLQYDIVYSIDSGFCFNDLFPRFSYYDIRHPAIVILTFPIWAIIHTVLRWFVPSQLFTILCASCIQIINVQALLLVGFIIGKMSGKKWTLLLYLASFSVLLYTMYLEKYQIAVALLVLYVYQTARNKDASTNLVLAAGAMPTSAFLYLAELFLKKPIKCKRKDLLKTLVIGISVLICSGRIRLLNISTLYLEVSEMAKTFGMKEFPIKNCIFSLTKMIHGIFLPLSSTRETVYIWTDILNTPSVIGLIIVAIAVLGAFVSNKKPFMRLCTVWMGIAIILFCIFQWSVHESPLFSIYFAWAVIPLFQAGFQYIIEKFHWKEHIAYYSLLIPMFIINVLNIIDIANFLKLL